jgi:hypothetical protein
MDVADSDAGDVGERSETTAERLARIRHVVMLSDR